jgi:MFS family permease
MMVIIYYMPIWFQAIKGDSAVKSGINTLPLVLSLVVASISAGQLTGRTGYYVPQLIACSVIMSIGAGLLTTLKVDTDHQIYIGYQVLYGFGLGFGMQQAGMAAQTCLDKKDVMIGVSIMFFFQSLGGAIWLSVAEVVFANSLVKNLEGIAGIQASVIVNTGATDLRSLVPPQYLDVVLVAYNKAISDVFKVAVGTACATIISGMTMEWKNLKGMKQGGPSGARQREQATVADPVSADATDDSVTPVNEVEAAAPEDVEKEPAPIVSKS